MQRQWMGFLSCVVLAFTISSQAALESSAPRQTISLDGVWQVAEGSMDKIPEVFDHTVQVPGLVDMAEPGFEEVGVKSDKREAFWYRRTFTIETATPGVALLKINKAKYGTLVYINGKLVGEHFQCFTPGYFDVRGSLKPAGQENELIIRIGASHDTLPASVEWGHDYEKRRYIPGIYDAAELILAGAPFIRNVQIVPEIGIETARVIADIQNIGNADEITANYRIRETKTGDTVAEGSASKNKTEGFKTISLDFRVPIKNCRLWSPEDPFLYELELTTTGDGIKEKFGMRSFRFDAVTGRAVLNGKPYFMRGSNVCIFRFFEDSERKDRPWNEAWVRELHRKFKSVNWNALRYCIGFPPEIWYDIADEEGILIQDEYPVWRFGKAPDECTAEILAGEYREWMEERWNHPCVVIWDAQNETRRERTGNALKMVRGLDLSNRPWDNGWSEPQHPDDCQEAHPYLFSHYKKNGPPESGPLSDQLTKSLFPHYAPQDRSCGDRKLNNPIIINEYAYIWINRDGSTTTLTDGIYQRCFPDANTAEKRRYHYARWTAALTEYWRAHLRCAGILHFCGLGYSRPEEPRGQTSDNFVDVEKLAFEPMFEKYARDAFAPVGLMINYWNSRTTGGTDEKIEVYIINDLEPEWKGEIKFRVEQNGKVLMEKTQSCTVEGYGRNILPFDLTMPADKGTYKLVAEIKGHGGETVTSFRDFEVVDKL